jgi:glycosyltransferase involved in cell wall biosynthesis
MDAFPKAPVYTSLFAPESTFPEYGLADVRSMRVNDFDVLRHSHRLAMPFLATSFSGLKVDAAVTICSTSGWAHGARTEGRKVVYCHNPARWLYQRDQYFGVYKGLAKRGISKAMSVPLKRWDRRAACSADRYLVNSNIVRERVQRVYGIEAEVLHPPTTYTSDHPQQPMGFEPGYWLVVSRLMPYKNVQQIVAAFADLPRERLVVVGTGPDEKKIRATLPRNVSLVGTVEDSELAWLYAHSRAVISASYEDFGLTPLEANLFGRPIAALAWGGHLDTVCDGLNGVLFDEPEPAQIKTAVRRLEHMEWPERRLTDHAQMFDRSVFEERLQQIAYEELAFA